jgi:hypothetical protein
MDLEDIMMENRMRQILESKIMQEGGCQCDCDMPYGNGVSVGGVLVGGKRRMKKKKPSAFNKKVAAYMRKTGVSLPVAAKRMAGSKSSKKRKPAKKRMAMSALQRCLNACRAPKRRKVRGGADSIKSLERQLKQLKIQKELEESELGDPEKKFIEEKYCTDTVLSNLKTPAELREFYARCPEKSGKKQKLSFADYEKARRLKEQLEYYGLNDAAQDKVLKDISTEIKNLKKK